MAKNKKGFTLLELLVVVAIIAILATAVIVVIVPGVRALDARERTRESHIISINTVITMAVLDSGVTLHDVVTRCRDTNWQFNPGIVGCVDDGGTDPLVRMSVIPLDPRSDDFYYIHTVEDAYPTLYVWSDHDESDWYCDSEEAGVGWLCDETKAKRF